MTKKQTGKTIKTRLYGNDKETNIFEAIKDKKCGKKTRETKASTSA